MDDFVPKTPTLCNSCYYEQTELNDTLLYEAQQQDPVTLQLFLSNVIRITLPPLH